MKPKVDCNSDDSFFSCQWLEGKTKNKLNEICANMNVGRTTISKCFKFLNKLKKQCIKSKKLSTSNSLGISDSPTTCVDLNTGYKFDYTRLTSDGLTEKEERTNRECKHLADENAATIKERCTDDNMIGSIVFNYCKATCDNCGDDSAAPSISIIEPECDATDNDNIKFDVNHSSTKLKGCKWLRNHPSNIAECCEVGKGAYLNCKETCESCD